MNIVIFSPTDSYSAEAFPGLRSDDQIVVVTWEDPMATAHGRIAVRQPAFGARIFSATRGNVLVRTIVRLLPTDTGARFWRATRGDSRVIDVVRSADLIVAPERDGGFAAWSWQRTAKRHGRKIAAVSGYPAARSVIARQR